MKIIVTKKKEAMNIRKSWYQVFQICKEETIGLIVVQQDNNNQKSLSLIHKKNLLYVFSYVLYI